MSYGLAIVCRNGAVLSRELPAVRTALRLARGHVRRSGLTLAEARAGWIAARAGRPTRAVRDAAAVWCHASRLATRHLARARCAPPMPHWLDLVGW